MMDPSVVAHLTPGLIGADACLWLAGLAATVPRGEAIVEVGVFQARTTCYLGAGAKAGYGAHVWGIDPWEFPGNPRRRGYVKSLMTRPATRISAERLVTKSGLDDQVTLVHGFSVDVGQAWDGPPVGLLFIDGDHRAEMVRRDWEAWRPHLTADAIIIFDDYGARWPGVVEVVDELVEAGVIVAPAVLYAKMALTRLP